MEEDPLPVLILALSMDLYGKFVLRFGSGPNQEVRTAFVGQLRRDVNAIRRSGRWSKVVIYVLSSQSAMIREEMSVNKDGVEGDGEGLAETKVRMAEEEGWRWAVRDARRRGEWAVDGSLPCAHALPGRHDDGEDPDY